MKTPLTIKVVNSNASIAKYYIQALFDEKPSIEDINGASKSIGFDHRAYLIGNIKCENVGDINSEEHGLCRCSWFALLD